MSYFNIVKDNQIVADGGFFCLACLTGRPAEAISRDSRYCRECYESLKDEASLLAPNRGKPGWVPRNDKTLPIIKCAKTITQHTLKDVPATVFAQPDGEQVKSGGGLTGRPAMTLPVEMIQNLYAQGAGVTEIMRQLKAKGYSPSKRTVYNVLAGREVMV